jgi:hypothetical protein
MQMCRACGRGPAADMVIRRHVGMLVMQRFVMLRVPLCRDCGMRVATDYSKRTAVQGWWGVISFFVNWFCLATNLIAYRKASGLAAPMATGGEHDERYAA